MSQSHLGDDEQPQDQDPQNEERPSRSARKRQAEALQKLGVGLTRMRPAKLHQLQQHLQLPEILFEAILEAQRLRSRSASARARQYIGRLMRDIDPAPIERALALHAPDLKARGARARDAKMPR